MKKIFTFTLFILISFICFFDSVKAYTLGDNFDLTDAYSNTNFYFDEDLSNYNYYNDLISISNYMHENYTNFAIWTNFANNNFYEGYHYSFYIFLYDTNNLTLNWTTKELMYGYLKGDIGISNSIYGIGFNNTYSTNHLYRYNIKYSSGINSLLNEIDNNNAFPFINSNGITTVPYTTAFSLSINKFSSVILFDTDMTFTIGDTYENNSYIIGDNSYTTGDTFPSYLEVNNSGPSYNLKNNINHFNSDTLELNMIFSKNDILDYDNSINFKISLENEFDNIISSLDSISIYGKNDDLIDEYTLLTDNELLYLPIEYELIGNDIVGTITFDDPTCSSIGICSFLPYSEYKVIYNFINTYNNNFSIYDDVNFTSYYGDLDFLNGYERIKFTSSSLGLALSNSINYNGRIYIENKYLIEDYLDFQVKEYFYNTDIISDYESIPFSSSDYLGFSYYNINLLFDSTSSSDNKIVYLLHSPSCDEDIYIYIPNDISVSEINYNGETAVHNFDLTTPNGTSTHEMHTNLDLEEEMFINSFSSSINYFVEPINYIMSLISTFFLSLPFELRIFFIGLFSLTISLFIVKFIL